MSYLPVDFCYHHVLHLLIAIFPVGKCPETWVIWGLFTPTPLRKKYFKIKYKYVQF